MSDALTLLERELAAWSASGLTPVAFLRDDDAMADTPALRRLFEVCVRHAARLLLACIPDPAEPSLADAAKGISLVTPAVHGFRHVNHSPKGEKTCELGRSRPLGQVLGELRQGRAKLLDMFGGKVSPILVPPWNRIHDEVAQHVAEAGFAAISCHGFDDRTERLGVAFLNVHVDIVHWSGGGAGRDTDWTFRELATAFGRARERGGAPVGLLAHHLAHDDMAWATLDAALARLAAFGARFEAADNLLPPPRPYA